VDLELFSSGDENELRFHESDVGWCTAFKEAYGHRCNSFNFSNLYVRLYWIRDIKDSFYSGMHVKVFLQFRRREHKPSEHG
jgi:hypothetical protein